MVLKSISRIWKDGAGRSEQDHNRRHLRAYPTQSNPVEVQIMGEDSLNILHARDVSLSGIGVVVPHRFEGCDIESGVELVLSFPNARSFKTRGRVVYRQEDATSTYFGIEFTDLDETYKDIITRFITTESGDDAPPENSCTKRTPFIC